MPEFDKQRFEGLMSEAVVLHNDGQYGAALTLSRLAHDIAPQGSSEMGRAARDNGARLDRLGRSDEAEQSALEAYGIHNHIVEGMDEPTREALRERSVSAMYVGVNGLRKVIGVMRDGRQAEQPLRDAVLDKMRLTLADLDRAKGLASGINQKFDQYEINASRRVSLAESLVGDKKKGLAIGAHAVRFAFISESRRLDTSETGLNTKGRLHAKTKAFIGGVTALGVGVLMTDRPGHRRQLAVKLADRML